LFLLIIAYFELYGFVVMGFVGLLVGLVVCSFLAGLRRLGTPRVIDDSDLPTNPKRKRGERG